MFLVLAFAASVPFVYDGNLRPGQRLAIRDVNGGIRVRAGDRLSIHATKTARRSDPNAVAIKVEPTSDGLVVCVRYPPQQDRGCNEPTMRHDSGTQNNDTSVDFDVTLPRGVALDASTVNGALDIATDGSTTASTVNGDVRVEGRDVHSASTVNGSIAVRITDRAAAALSAKTVNGSIDVSLPSGSGVAFHAETLNGSIHADGVEVQRPRWGPGEHASATLGDGSRHVSLATLNGSITLRR